MHITDLFVEAAILLIMKVVISFFVHQLTRSRKIDNVSLHKSTAAFITIYYLSVLKPVTRPTTTLINYSTPSDRHHTSKCWISLLCPPSCKINGLRTHYGNENSLSNGLIILFILLYSFILWKASGNDFENTFTFQVHHWLWSCYSQKQVVAIYYLYLELF